MRRLGRLVARTHFPKVPSVSILTHSKNPLISDATSRTIGAWLRGQRMDYGSHCPGRAWLAVECGLMGILVLLGGVVCRIGSPCRAASSADGVAGGASTGVWSGESPAGLANRSIAGRGSGLASWARRSVGVWGALVRNVEGRSANEARACLAGGSGRESSVLDGDVSGGRERRCGWNSSLFGARLLVKVRAAEQLPFVAGPVCTVDDETACGASTEPAVEPWLLARAAWDEECRARADFVRAVRSADDSFSGFVVGLGQPVVEGRCSATTVARDLAGRYPKWRRCYKQGLSADPMVSGTIEVSIPKELSDGVTVVGDGTDISYVVECVKCVAESIRATWRISCGVKFWLQFYYQDGYLSALQNVVRPPFMPAVCCEAECAHRNRSLGLSLPAATHPTWPDAAPPGSLQGLLVGLLSDQTYTKSHAALVWRGAEAAQFLVQLLNAPPGHPSIRYFETYAGKLGVPPWRWRQGWRIPLVLADLRENGVERALLHEVAKPLGPPPPAGPERDDWARENIARLRVVSRGLAATLDEATLSVALSVLADPTLDWFARAELTRVVGLHAGRRATVALQHMLPDRNAGESNEGALGDLALTALPGGGLHWGLVQALALAARVGSEGVLGGACRDWVSSRARWWSRKPAEVYQPSPCCLRLEETVRMTLICKDNRDCYRGVLLDGMGVNSATGERFGPCDRQGCADLLAVRAHCRMKAALIIPSLPPPPRGPDDTLGILADAWMTLPGSDAYEDVRFALLLGLERAARGNQLAAYVRLQELVAWYGPFELDHLQSEWAWRLWVSAFRLSSKMWKSTSRDVLTPLSWLTSRVFPWGRWP